ncbi:hypothetical protein [Streptomyces reniochalinae]|uniref:Uncharacterized protein n=1 Tax=Streptomyces reniochalinae TaxID=2250578 RepID=A0A367F2S1_9ACTN|nr:hypothetical protein [Streptomyces reniochalinae]RCG24182.1 hypothetical protein DQ392_03370 [Streptomyces reniochalinae]
MRITDCDRAHLVVNEAQAHEALQAIGPGQLVVQARRLMEKAEELLEQAVIAERQRDTSWEQVGEALGGLSKSAAHKRYGAAVNDWASHYDGTSTEDEVSGQEVFGRNSSFVVAYRLVERTWEEAEEIVDDQELLADLREATTAASGAGSPWSGSHVSAPDRDDEEQLIVTGTGTGKSFALASLVTKYHHFGQRGIAAAPHLFGGPSDDQRHPDQALLEARLAIVEHQVAALLADRDVQDTSQ